MNPKWVLGGPGKVEKSNSWVVEWLNFWVIWLPARMSKFMEILFEIDAKIMSRGGPGEPSGRPRGGLGGSGGGSGRSQGGSGESWEGPGHTHGPSIFSLPHPPGAPGAKTKKTLKTSFLNDFWTDFWWKFIPNRSPTILEKLIFF